MSAGFFYLFKSTLHTNRHTTIPVPNVHSGFGYTYFFNIAKHYFILVSIAEYKYCGWMPVLLETG